MVLLDLFTKVPDVELIVAHFDHGIRAESAGDRRFVQGTAGRYGVSFVYAEGRLGVDASEETARNARYAFLQRVKEEKGAIAILTAHHRGDVLETAILNLARGTGRRGLSSLRSTNEIIRPLLGMPKQTLYDYAKAHDLQWREDSTNADETYLRNYIRRRVVPRFTNEQHAQLQGHITTAGHLNDEIDKLLTPYIQGLRLPRQWFIMLPHIVACEVMASWLRRHGAAFDRRAVDRLTIFAKTAFLGKRASIDATHRLETNKQYIILLANQ
jgi:tRNA(Ile)-lysidine synthase